MPFESFSFLDDELPLPFCFTTRLPFTEDDRRDMPWLASDQRNYGVDKVLGKGGTAIALKGHVMSRQSRPLKNTPSIVLKVPNINPDEYTSELIRDYLRRLADEGGREWQLTRRRLHGCEYANPIFDFNVFQVRYLGELMPLPVTVQLFLNNATSLDEYLLKTRQRTQPYMSQKGVPHDNWNGMPDPTRWIELARGLATALVDIHQRRVVHGDIWPPNVFIRCDDQNRPVPIFIDFGEAFPIEPQGMPREQRDHAYRAPERNDGQCIVTQQADVYSFGKLLLHLAVGAEPILSPKYRGHERRDRIRKMFCERNSGIVSDNPFIIDIICNCISLDPVDRPSMIDVLRALDSYVDVGSHSAKQVSVSKRLQSLGKTWDSVNAELAARKTSAGPFLEELVDQRLDEIEWIIKGLSNDVVNLTDTRERLILALVGLFQRLGKGDRFLSITSPRMWQGAALGLDGRYFTAAELATVRGASVQRAFTFSVQEVGDEWALELCRRLEEIPDSAAGLRASKLAIAIRTEVNRYNGARQGGKMCDLPEDLKKDARERLKLVIKSYRLTSEGICQGAFDPAPEFTASKDCQGMYVGLIPVSTLSAMRTLKSTYPVSVFYYSQAGVNDRYLLMMTDCLGRNSYGGSEESTFDDLAYQRSRPELRGITVFKSVLGVPEDRIKKMEKVFRRSVSIGGWLKTLEDALPD